MNGDRETLFILLVDPYNIRSTEQQLIHYLKDEKMKDRGPLSINFCDSFAVLKTRWPITTVQKYALGWMRTKTKKAPDITIYLYQRNTRYWSAALRTSSRAINATSLVYHGVFENIRPMLDYNPTTYVKL